MSAAAESHKHQGNIYFGQQLYDQAIVEYTTAIIQNPNNPVYYTNRALCYLKTQQYDFVIGDCEKATLLDAACVKGHYLMGQALSNADHRLDRALATLRKAYQLAIEQRVSYAEEIAHGVRKAKKRKWEVADKRRRETDSELFRYLGGLIENERRIQLSEADPADVDLRTIINSEQDTRLSELTALFTQAGIESARRREVPDYYMGKISFEVMTDPVTTPSGITYDRTEILQHLNKIGQFDPLSRTPMTESDLVPNLALKEAIDEFLDNNGWAVDY